MCSVGEKRIWPARVRVALVFFLARVISFSVRRWASFALGQVVVMDSWVRREVTRLRRRDCRWAEWRPRCRCFMAPPAMAGGWVVLGDVEGLVVVGAW